MDEDPGQIFVFRRPLNRGWHPICPWHILLKSQPQPLLKMGITGAYGIHSMIASIARDSSINIQFQNISQFAATV